jgi:PAS domain S-box-containing protein
MATEWRPESAALRRRAELRLAKERGPSEPAHEALSPAESAFLEVFHELRVHQIELELQNEELRRVQLTLEESHDALGVSEQRYRDLFENAPVAYLQLDHEGRIRSANAFALALLDIEPAALGRDKFSEFVSAPSQDAYYLYRRALLEGRRPDPIEIELRATDRIPSVPVELHASLARLSGSTHAELLVALLDLTARRRSEYDRAESERQRRLMADALPIPVSYVDAAERYQFCNASFASWHGLGASEIRDRALHEVLGAVAYAQVRDHVRAALVGRTSRFEGEIAFAVAGRRAVSIVFAPDRADDGNVRGYYELVDDRSSLRRAELRVRDAAARAEMAEEEQRRALAADLHDDVGQLLSLLAIKLRALEDTLQGDASRAVGEIHGLADQARQRISTLSFALSPGLLFDVGLLAASERLTEDIEAEYGLHVDLEAIGDLGSIDEVTRVALYRSLRELLINAAKHAGTGQARVVLSADGGAIEIRVSDEGQGFEPRMPTRGFGLVNLRNRIESLGGSVEVASAPGQGATFQVTLPKRRPDTP